MVEVPSDRAMKNEKKYTEVDILMAENERLGPRTVVRTKRSLRIHIKNPRLAPHAPPHGIDQVDW
jgi:hypothetical protein